MSQKTNLNVSPYYDDFDANQNFYRVLFKPGFPVQSRELTSLQSILQNQIESFGDHVFKDGSVVIPGNVTYNDSYYAVKINPTHVGLSVGLYLNNLIGKKIKGQTSQITAVIQNVLTNVESESNDYTLYVKYITSDANFRPGQLLDGETLILQENLTYGNTTIASGDTFATLIAADATATASAVSITEGVYYIRGHFVNVSDDTLILDQYSNTPSYRVGLFVAESFVDAQSDANLYDNARGFSNYAAPGADRLKISASLTKKRLTDLDDKNFVELIRVTNGVVKKVQDTDSYALLKEYIAKRTYEESGDYVVDPFSIEVNESLNDRTNSEGVFYPNQRTDQGNTPSEDLLALKISPGKAYIKGFDVEKPVTTILDVSKSRDTNKVESTSIPFQMGNLLKVNNIHGTPRVGIDNNFTINLNSQRRTNVTHNTSGNTIGKARIYSFSKSDSDISSNTNNQNWDLYLWDIQTYTELRVNSGLSALEMPASSYIKGLSSGASGYSVSAGGVEVGGKTIRLINTSGTFQNGEQVSINGTNEYTRSINSIKAYTADDIKSVYQGVTAEGTNGSTGLTTAFAGDTVLTGITPKGFSSGDKIDINWVGIATISGRNFVGIKNDAIIKYIKSPSVNPTYNRVLSVDASGIKATLSPIEDVSGVIDGDLPTSTKAYEGTFQVAVPQIINEDRKQLYAPLNAKNVSEVDLSDSSLSVRRQVGGKSTDDVGSVTVSLADVNVSNGFFEPFAADRYSVHYANGTSEELTSNQLILGANSSTVTLTGLLANQSGNVRINTTLKKSGVTNKQKLYIRSSKLDVNKTVSGINTVTTNAAGVRVSTGLSTCKFNGLRIEDKEISLNVPDVANIVAVYESIDINDIQLDKLTFAAGLNLDTSSILGERIVGSSSGAVGQIVTRSSATAIEFVYLNSNKFALNETVRFEESNLSGAISAINVGDFVDKTHEFTLDKGQREQYYDYSRLVRNSDSYTPIRKLLVIFDYYQVPDSDNGDVYTVESYDKQRYKKDIPVIGNQDRASDIIDFRPRVAKFTSITSSPFDYSNRTFASSGNNPTLVVSPNESSVLGYSYYLPRIDKVILNKNGNLSVVKGVSADNPKPPSTIEEGMELVTIKLPAYLYTSDSVKASVTGNKRYTMRDIGKLEDRINNVETLTSLTILELDTKTLQVQDVDGITRFKSGFFVDNFKNTNFIDIGNVDANVCVDTQSEELKSDNSLYSLKSQISPLNSLNIDVEDFSSNFTLLDDNVKKTGDLVTLNYSEVAWTNLEQNFATKKQQINPFGIANYNGFVKLTPSSDTWVRTINSELGVISQTQSQWTDSYISNLITSSTPHNKLRSRSVEFRASGLQPATNYYSFFGGNGSIDIVPKLIKVTMVGGVFQAGEIVSGYLNGKKISSFRLANSNHKTGIYNNPSTTYSENPYSPSLDIVNYSSSSSILNIDTYSLADDADGRFYGYSPVGMLIIGETSNAQATVLEQTLVSDSVGDIIGSFFIRDPLINPTPPITINTGSTSFKLTSSSTNSTATSVTFTESVFYGSGIVDSSVYTESVVIRRPPNALPLNALRRDPLSQTFRTDNEGGFLTGVDLYFAEKDTSEKVFVEIRESDIGGRPKDKLVQDFARVEINSSGITTSSDGTTATNVKLPSPLYLQPNKQYAISLISPSSDDYKVWIAQSNQATVTTQAYPNAEQIVYSNQYTGGNLYKPQNGAVWTSSLNEDLKFKFYKANFTSSTGAAYFHNPNISIGSTYLNRDANIPKLTNNPIKTFPRKLKVGINTGTPTALSLVSTEGIEVSNMANSASGSFSRGTIEFLGGNVGVITNSNPGIGYSNGTYSNVPLYNINGYGEHATATVQVLSNKVHWVSIANTGNGYKSGDLLGLSTSFMTKGAHATVSVSNTPNIDTLFLTNVQGEQFSKDDVIHYRNGSGNWTTAGGTQVRDDSTTVDALHSGNVFEVNHYSHGMQADTNTVSISGLHPNTPAVALNASVVSSNTTISLGNTSEFTHFEGKTVGSANTGYLLVNDEVISYTAVNAGNLTILNRGVNDSVSKNHAINDLVYKYELNGVSLARLNNSHSMPNSTSLSKERDIDRYHLEFDRTQAKESANRSTNADMLSFTDERTLGGSTVNASQNIQFNEIIPQFNTIVPENTNVSATLRTVSGTSAGGSEASFVDKGFESVSLNEINKLSSPRIVASRINETNRLSTLPRSKSLTLGVKMETSNSNLSPVIDLSEAATFVFNRNRINNPISDYASDSRVNASVGDPHASVYISKKINLIQPASSLKVIFSAYRHASSDFRVLYKLFKADSSEIDQSYQLFPGYSNLVDTDGDGIGDVPVELVIDGNIQYRPNGDGLSDANIRASLDDEFLEYQYTADDIGLFNGFVIKIVMSGTNEAHSPRIRDLRAIALA